MNSSAHSATSEEAVIEAIVAGHICLDVIPTLLGGKIDFLPGRLVEAGPAIMSTGGAVSNTGLCLHRLGVSTRLMGKIGDDLFGDAVRTLIEAHGANLAGGMLISPGESTSYSIILSPSGRDRMFIHAPGCNATFDEHDVDYSAVARARLFHFGYPPLMARTFRRGGDTLVSIFQSAKATGVTTSLDLSMPDMNGPAGSVDWPKLLARTLPFVDIFAPSIEELMLMMRAIEYRRLTQAAGENGIIDLIEPLALSDLGDELLGIGAKLIAIKLGHRGIYLRSASASTLSEMGRAKPADTSVWADRELWAPCFEADVMGTTGSGDATIAGLLKGLLSGMSPEQSIITACAVGACSVEAADALSGIRSWPETFARIEAGWPRRPAAFESPRWAWNDRIAAWTGPRDRA